MVKVSSVPRLIGRGASRISRSWHLIKVQKDDGAVVALASAGSLDVSRSLAVLVCLAAAGWGQSVELGITGGIPVTEAYETGTGSYGFCNYAGASSATRRYTVGPEFRMSLPHGFGVATGALYKRLGYDSYFEAVCLAFYTRSIENSWEFPVMVSYRLTPRLPGTPYVAAGPSFRAATSVSLSGYETYPGGYTPNVNPSTSTHAMVDRRSRVGFAAGLGGEAKSGRLRIRPELRYTRWAASTNQFGASDLLQSNRNQVEFLLSFGIRVR
jgi:hypothetical protein